MKYIEKLKFASVCGIDCETQCAIYKAYNVNNQLQRRKLALMFLKDENRWPDIRCDGCKGEQAICWGKNCPIKQCAFQKELEFCIECNNYPCQALLKQQKKNEIIKEIQA